MTDGASRAGLMDGSQPSLPDELVERAIYRRGRLAVHDTIDATRTALLVVDMQNAWLAPGAPFETPVARTIVPAIDRLASALRGTGGLVVWLRHTAATKGAPLDWPGYYDTHVAERYRAETRDALAAGTRTHAVADALDVHEADWTLDKYRFSPFVRSDVDFEARLVARGIDSVIVAGTATNVAVESTARDAMMRDFRTFVPHDAVVAPYYDGHLAAMRSLVQLIADVRPVDELIALIRTPQAA